MTSSIRIAVYVCIAAILASCTPLVDNRGHNPTTDDFSQIIEGQSGKDDVQTILGTPSARANFGEETWYYIAHTKQRVGLFAPETTEQKVTSITFDASGKVKAIERYKKEDGKPVTLVTKKTSTEGQKLTFIEQMLGNLGRFNAPGGGTDPRAIQRR